MILFSQPEQSRKIGTIVRRSSSSIWIIKDAAGRETLAASAEQWQPGDGVVVIGGEIVGRSGKQPAVKIYEV